MKHILKLSLAAMTSVALMACGGSSEDIADKYVGDWKSGCQTQTGSDGSSAYFHSILFVTKTSAAEIYIKNGFRQYSDSSCNSLISAGFTTSKKISFGTETTFLGAKADNIVYTFLGATNQTFLGYSSVNNSTWHLSLYAPGTNPTQAWSSDSPYIKQ
jgi:hypothetical protein